MEILTTFIALCLWNKVSDQNDLNIKLLAVRYKI